MKGSVLVVDDEQVVLRSCERVLGAEGYAVASASSAEQAVGMLCQHSFDLIITDLKMPGMNGLEFIRQVRAGHADTNIVVITGYPSQESIRESLGLGIVDYLPKPFSPALLLEAVGRGMDLRKKDITADTVNKLDEIIRSYKDKPGSLIPVLQEAQEHIGYLPAVVQSHIARGLRIPVSEVHGVVSFYSFFTMKPRGKHHVRVCLGTACYVKGAEEVVKKCCDGLSIEVGGVTEDRKFSIETVRCLGACGLAPVVVVDRDDTYGHVNPNKVLDLLKGFY